MVGGEHWYFFVAELAAPPLRNATWDLSSIGIADGEALFSKCPQRIVAESDDEPSRIRVDLSVQIFEACDNIALWKESTNFFLSFTFGVFIKEG